MKQNNREKREILPPFFIGISFLFLLFFPLYSAQAKDQKTSGPISSPKKFLQLKEEKFSLQTKKIKGKVWPKVLIQAYIPFPSLDCAAIFSGFEHQRNYIPHMKESQVIKEKVTKTHNDIHVKYKMNMPWPLSDSTYTNGHHLEAPKERTYRLSWYLIENEQAHEVRGEATFSPFPQEEKTATLLTYSTFVNPKSFFAGALRKFMIKDVQSALKATIKEIERLEKTDPSMRKKLIKNFQSLLSGEPIYFPQHSQEKI